MSYSLLAKIVDKKTGKLIADCDVSSLKNINERSYSLALNEVESTGKGEFKDLLKYNSYEFKALVRKSIMNDSAFKELVKPYHSRIQSSNDDFESYFINEEDANTYNDYINNFIDEIPLNDLITNHEALTKTYYNLYIKKEETLNGEWFVKNDFVRAKEYYEHKYDEAREKLRKLNEMRLSPAYYEMSEKAQNNFFEDIKYAEDDVEEYKWQVESVNYMIFLFSFFELDYAVPTGVDANGDPTEDWYSREVEIFIWAE